MISISQIVVVSYDMQISTEHYMLLPLFIIIIIIKALDELHIWINVELP